MDRFVGCILLRMVAFAGVLEGEVKGTPPNLRAPYLGRDPPLEGKGKGIICFWGSLYFQPRTASGKLWLRFGEGWLHHMRQCEPHIGNMMVMLDTRATFLEGK